MSVCTKGKNESNLFRKRLCQREFSVKEKMLKNKVDTPGLWCGQHCTHAQNYGCLGNSHGYASFTFVLMMLGRKNRGGFA